MALVVHHTVFNKCTSTVCVYYLQLGSRLSNFSTAALSFLAGNVPSLTLAGTLIECCESGERVYQQVVKQVLFSCENNS